MNRTLLAFMLVLCSVVSAQVEVVYPYNPDGNADSVISAPDLLDLLPIFGGAFTPEEVTVDGESLSNVLLGLNATIDSMASLPTVYQLNGSGELPLGTILSTASPSAPDGWMICDGREIPIDEFQGLYDLIGTTYGAGDSAFWAQVFYPATTFNIPDLRGRTVVGGDGMGTEGSAGVVTAHQTSLGESGGEEFHQLTIEEMPSHSHGGIHPPGWQCTHAGLTDVGSTNCSESAVEPTGGDQPHNNMQPYLALNFMIKVESNTETALNLQEQVDSLASVLASMQIEGDSDSSLGPCQGELTVNYHGYDYELVEIGDQCWFAENLRTTQFRNSDNISLGLPAELNPLSGYLPAANPICGCVYNTAVVYDERELCPSGFGIPKVTDFSALMGFTTGLPLVNDDPAGFNVLFGGGTAEAQWTDGQCSMFHPFWTAYPWGNTDETGFLTSTLKWNSPTSNIYPGGDPDEYWNWYINGASPGSYMFGHSANYKGRYVRCIKDQ